MIRSCGWLWMHDPPAFLSSSGREHECVRPPGHPGSHACYCGDTDA